MQVIAARTRYMCYLVLVCFFLHNSRVTSTEMYCKHMGKIVICMTLATYPLRTPANLRRSPSLGPATLCKHEIDAVNQVVVRRSEARIARLHGPYLSI